MPNTSGKEFDRRYNNRRKSNEDDYYSNVHFQYQDGFNQMYRNSSRDKKSISSFQSSSSDMKQPLRSYGDWSEFLSSNGKIYFYNRKTERAQWDKPDEWDWLMMQEDKTSKAYYQQSSKDNRSTNRFRNKYENSEIFDSNAKSQRYNYDKYHRDYSNDYINSNQPNTFRQNYNINDRCSNQNVSMLSFPQSNSIQMNDYYDSSQNYPLNVSSSSSASNSDYYPKNNQMYRNNNYHNGKDWSQMSKMQYIPNGTNNINSPNNTKNSPRYPNQYDDSNMNKPYSYQQHRHHMNRYDNFSENPVNNQKCNYNQSNNSSYQNPDYNNFNNNINHNINNTATTFTPTAATTTTTASTTTTTTTTTTTNNNNNNNLQSSNLNKSNNNLNKDQKFASVVNQQPSIQNVSHNQSRCRANSGNTGLSPTNKKFKRSEDYTQSRNADEESWDQKMEEKPDTENHEKEQIQKKSENQSYNGIEKISEVKEENKIREKIEEKSEKNIKTEAEESKENQMEHKHADPVLTSTVDDINKYYRSELVDRLTNCLGVVENLAWVNQSYSKHFYYSKLSVDIKKYRSIVRVKEIKKTQLEQRLLFLQNQMREIEELLG